MYLIIDSGCASLAISLFIALIQSLVHVMTYMFICLVRVCSTSLVMHGLNLWF
ncbi:hypothetical protein LINPERPRIM_LOCUS5782 [Linum perenne]